MTRRGAGAPGAGLHYLGSEDQERIMKTLGLAILVATAIGCGASMGEAPDATPGPDAGAETGATDAGEMSCGLVAGAAYATHWAEDQGNCGAAGDLDVTVSSAADPCGAIGQHVPAGLGDGEFSVGCYTDAAHCAVFAAVAFHGCQGSYRIVFAAK